MACVSYDRRAVTIDGRRTLVLSGAVHYPRSTPAMWPDLMRETRAAGLNTVETYVFWNLHERRRGVLDFSDRLDLVRFCRLAQEAGLHVILRIGPYICAETNYGGLPPWLRDLPGIRMRTWNRPFMDEMARWVRVLCEALRPMFAPAGGPIILAQIENEYANIAKHYGEDGRRYLAWSVELGQSLNLGVPWVMCYGGALARWKPVARGRRTRPLAWYRAAFDRPGGPGPLGLDLRGMTKGLAWVNGRCLGRYWLAPAAGDRQEWLARWTRKTPADQPTQRYYHVPREWLGDRNTLVLFDELGGDPSGVALARA